MFRKRPEGRFFYAWPVVFRVIWRILVYMKSLLANKVARMSQSELLDAIYTDTLTGMWNRRAFEESPDSKYIAIVDVDSLKWVNDNAGHRTGDVLLVNVARTLQKLFGDRAFRLSGDEYVVRADTKDELHARLNTNDRIFSYGVGRTLDKADIALTMDKNDRLRDGTRAGRGEKPTYEGTLTMMAIKE